MPRTTRCVVALSSSAILALVGVGLSVPSASANGLAPPGCGETFSGGNGTTADPFLISSDTDLTALNGDSNCWAGEFLQTANIDMGAATWNATTGTSVAPFSGTYNGSEYTISNLEISISGDNAGLFGFVTGTVRNVRFVTSLEVYGTDYVGGLVGYLDGGTISNSSSTAPVVADNAWAGGLVGYAAAGSSIDASYSSGSVVASDSNAKAGGLVGENDGSISDSYATGTVTGGSNDDYIGGLVGSNAGTVSGSYATGTVLTDGGEYVGGLIGENSGTVSDSYATGTVKHDTGDDPGVDVGGLIGLLEQDARVTNSYATGTVTGRNDVGGLIGRMRSGSSVSGSYATGSVTRAGTGDDKDVGGLVGSNNSGSISNCYATGAVAGGNAGGLVGVNAGTVTNCYSIGTVTGDSTGGLVQANTGTVSNSFWDTETSGVESSAGGTGKTTAEMKTLTTFADAGWSITDSCSSTAIWGLCTTRNSGYPYLTFYTAPPTPSDTFVPFSFLLPDGRECTSISPISVAVGSQFRLPSADALCGTMTGSQIIGWTIPSPIDYTGAGSTSMPFAPGQLVRVVEGQRFTAVLWEPILQLDFDANIATRDTCLQTKALHTSDDGRLEHVWVPRADISMARFPASSSCVPEGYVLIGWNTAGDGSGETYEPGAAVPEDWAEETANSHRLFAVWAPSL